MISEKTVELNVTAELLNFLFRLTKRTHTAIAPSQRAEGKVGYDVAYLGSARAALIQYKRAHVDRAIWSWQLNRTRVRDQHRRLQTLEAAGLPVYYAFPLFYTPAEVVSKRVQLLKYTFWYPPSLIQPPGGPTGHHTVFYDPARQRWWVSSPEEIELAPPRSITEVAEAFGDEAEPLEWEHLETMLNEILAGADEPFEREAFSEQSLVVHPESPSGED